MTLWVLRVLWALGDYEHASARENLSGARNWVSFFR
jgi:hypothetical protein